MNYIDVGSDSLPIKFGFRVVRKSMAKLKLKKWNDWVQIPSLAEFDDIPAMMHGALECGAKTAGDQFDMTLEQVEDLLDENPHLVTQMWEIFIDDMTPADKKEQVKSAIDEATDEAVKAEVEKNRIGTTLSESPTGN